MTEALPIEELETMGATYNPREITQAEVDDLAGSLERWGFVQPVIVNRRTWRIVGGHQRVRAAAQLGLEAVPVEYVDLDEAEEKALNLALNRIGGRFVASQVGELLRDIRRTPAAAFTGFTETESARMIKASLSTVKVSTSSAKVDDWGATTALVRSSAPMRHWRELGLLEGRVLDFGSGQESHEFARWDPFTEPDPAPLLETWDTVTCHYVLNVQPADHLVDITAALIRKLLAPQGRALFAIVTDPELSDTPACGNRPAKNAAAWCALLERFFIVQRAKGASFVGFVCLAKPEVAG